MIDEQQVKESRGTSLILSVLVVLICLAGTGAFLWWYVESGNQPQTIALKEPSVVAPPVNQPIRPMMLGPGPQVPPRQGPNGQRRFGNRPMNRVFGAIFRGRNGWQVRGGTFALNISAAARPGDPPTMELRLNGIGVAVLPMPPDFAIVRRVAHEDVIAHQLSITPDQMKTMVTMADDPEVRGSFTTLYPVLPLLPQDLKLLQKDWAAYEQQTNHQPGGAAERAMETDLAQAGQRSVQVVKAIYDVLEAKIQATLTHQQIALYYALLTGRVKSAGVVSTTTQPAPLIKAQPTLYNGEAPTSRP